MVEIAVVTGASDGLGAGIAKVLAKEVMPVREHIIIHILFLAPQSGAH